MAQVVELPGEANPLSLQNLQNALAEAASSTQQRIRTGTLQLHNWEKQEMYHTFLQDVFLDHSAPLETRSLAIIQLKNGIDKYWRKSTANMIRKEEKDRIKTRALEAGVREPIPVLALQNALVVSKIMRYEFPHDWPDAIPFILTLLRSPAGPEADYIQLPRTLLILLQIIKELSTARLQRSRTALQSISPEVFQVLGTIYVEWVNKWALSLKNGGDEETALQKAVERSLLCLKIIRRLVIAGFDHPNRNKEIQTFWALTHSHFSKFLSFLHGPVNASEQVCKLIGRHLLQLSKFHVEMAKSHPASFILLPDSIPLVQSYWGLVMELGGGYAKFDNYGELEWRSLLGKTGLKALLLVRACAKMAFNPIHSFKYQTAHDKEERKQAVSLARSNLFTEGFVVEAMEVLVTKFFRLRECDFQDWEADPEEWEKKEETTAEAWEFSIRSCSEKLFLDIIVNFKELLIPRLLNVFYTFAKPDNNDLLLKESLYSAIGLAVATLEQHLNFNAFLESTLVAEVQIEENGYNLLRRRIAILLGQWVPVKPKELNSNSIFQIFQHLLNKQDRLNDLVVRITAGRQLQNVLNPYEFSPTEFMPYAPAIMQSLMTLIQEIELPDTKMGLLETVRVAVVKMEDHIAPFADQILSLLPPLWEASGEEHLMKQAILTLLSSLMYSLKHESSKYHSLILPLIRSSVDPASNTSIYLLDEALELWSSIMVQTPGPASPEILSLFPALFQIFEGATDSAPLALQIAESYIVLAPQEMLNDEVRFHLLVSLEGLLKSTARQRVGAVPHLVEMVIRGAEVAGGDNEGTYSLIFRSLIDTSLLSSLLEGLYSAYEASESTGPNRKATYVYGVMESDYFSVLARLALASPRGFASAVSAATGTPEEQSLTWILTEWFRHYDNIGTTGQKKLHVLGLTQLISFNGPDTAPPRYILNHLQSYLSTWTDIVTELAENISGDPDDSKNGDYLVCWNNTPTEPLEWAEPPGNERRRDWDASDVIHRINIRNFIRQHLRSVIAGCGGEQQFQEEWLSNVDRDAVSAFGALGLY